MYVSFFVSLLIKVCQFLFECTDFKNVLKWKTQVFQIGAKNKSSLIILDTEAEHVNSCQCFFFKKKSVCRCGGDIKQMGANICREIATSATGTVFLFLLSQ